MSPSWESRLEAARKARADSAGEGAPAASRELPLPENVTWHRVSLVTPLLEGWKIVTGVLAFVMAQNLDDLVRAYRFVSEHGFTLGGGIGYYLLGLVAFIALWVGLGLLSWWRRAYAVDADGVYLRSGILSRKLRTARLPRIQSVDVVHPLLGRIFGLGKLTVEVAGGRGSRVVIGFLTTRELQTLRDRILDLSAGQIDLPDSAVEGGAVGASAVGRDTGGIDNATSAVRPEGLAPDGAAGSQTAPEQRAVPMQASHFREHPLYSVDGSVLLGSLLRSSSVYVLGLAVIGMLSAGILILVSDSMTGSEALTIISSYLTMVIAMATIVWSHFNSAWNFQAAATPSGIRMSYG
uniref:PH domain-containing protein n=1 Tax=Actinomyces oris TaxID=544580 RepID=UPI00242CB699